MFTFHTSGLVSKLLVIIDKNFASCLSLDQHRTQLRLRPWPNDQTLLVKHLQFACQTFKHSNIASQTIEIFC